MNIGLFSDSYYPLINGVTTSVSILSQKLEALGHTVYIFAPDAPNLTEDNNNIIRMASMPCIFLKGARVGLSYSPHDLVKISKLHLDIVHTQTEFPLGIFGKVLSKTLNIPMVHTYHTMYEDYVHYIVNGAIITSSMAKDYSRVFCNHANAVIAPTNKVKKILEDYGVNKNISVIPTGINIDHFRKSNYDAVEIENLRSSLNIGKDVPVILSLGRVAKEKSIDVVINSIPKLLGKLPNAKLVIVGDGPVKNDLEDLVKSLNIQENVIFTGAKKYEDIGKYYQLGNVFVSASITETQGLTFAEAMAAGVPVVAKNDPSILGIVNDEETGLLFNSDEELADKLIEILTDSAKSELITEKAMNLVEGLSAETFAKSVETLYLDIIENNENYGYHKHSKIFDGPKSLRRKAVKKIKHINNDITEEINRQKYLLKNIAKKTMSWYSTESSEQSSKNDKGVN